MAKTETSLIELKDYEGKYNVLFPQSQMTQISPYHRIRVEEVKIDPNPDNGDVFKVGSKKVGSNWQDVLSLSKTGILKLATAAGIVWNWQETKVLSSSKDYVLFQAVGAMRKPSGEWIPLKSTKEIDLDVIEAETYESNLKKAESMNSEQRKGMTPELWADTQTKNNMIQWKKNKLMRAETGAMLRVVRALLSIKHQYSPQELKKPFAVPTVDFTPDYSDPEVKRMVAAQSLKSASELFGQSNMQQLSSGQQMSPPINADDFQKDQGHHYIGAPVEGNDVIDVTDNHPDTASGDDLPWGSGESTSPEGDDGPPPCADCGQDIAEHGKFSASQIVDHSVSQFGRALCYGCGAALAKKGGSAQNA